MPGRLANETRVRTVKPEREAGDWTKEALASRKWGTYGTVTTHHDSHGLTYEVQHLDGTTGHYEHEELAVVGEDVYQDMWVDWLTMRVGNGIRALRELVELVGKDKHADGCALGAVPSCTCGLREAQEAVKQQKWETVNGTTDRLVVPGGWLYRSRAYKAVTRYESFPNEYAVTAESTTFVPSPPGA